MNLWRALGERGVRLRDTRSCLPLEVDERRGVGGGVHGLRDDGHDRCALCPRDVGDEQRRARHDHVREQARHRRSREVRDVGAGHDGHDTRRVPRRIESRAREPRVRVRAPDEHDVAQTARLEIVDVPAGADDEGAIFAPAHRAPDPVRTWAVHD